MEKFQTSIHFWHTVGGGLEEQTIQELEEHGYDILPQRRVQLHSR